MNRRRTHHRPVFHFVLCVFAVAPILAATAAEPIRLELLLNEAKISSPLLRVHAVKSLSKLPRVTAHNLLKRDFESGGAQEDATGCSIANRSGERALHYRGGTPSRCFFLVAVEPAAHYLIRRRVHTDEPRVDLAVLESRVGLAHPEQLNHPADLTQVLNSKLEFLARGTLLYTHHFDKPRPGRWQSDSLHVFTTQRTQTLVIMVQDAEGIASTKPGNTWFDDIEVERLEPRLRQELALFKGFGLAPGSDPALGIAKHGQLLPVSGVVAPPYDANYEFRHALFAPAPTSLRYQLTIPAQARLQFSYAMFKASRPGDAARFRIVAAHGGRETELFRRRIVVRANGQGWHWRQASVDLSALAGQQVELRLETTAQPRTRGYALWGNPVIDTPRSAEDPPNVLLIGVDTLRADRMSAYGYPRNTSTHTDALAADGVRFERALSNSNWTAPSFASLLTGLTPSQHLVIHRASAVAPEIATLAEYFRDAGWLTRGIAYKAYLYNMGFEQGFDSWLGIPAVASTADAVLEKADEWIHANGDRRFFLFLHFNDPHQPFNQPSDFENRYGSSEVLAKLGLKLPFTTTLLGQVEGCSSCSADAASFKTAVSDLYDGEVAYLDDRIGKLVDTLRSRGLYDDTIIAFVSDHGESLFDRGQFFGHGRHYLFDELVRVPLIIKPHQVRGLEVADWARGRVVSEQVRSFDLMPTLLDLAGIDYDADAITAMTLRPALELGEVGETGAEADAVAIQERLGVSENLRWNSIALSWQGWKYVFRHAPDKPVEHALYRFETDPGERQNVIDRYPAVTERLRARMIDYFLQYRAGYYVVATGGQRDDTVQLQVRSDGAIRSARSLLGSPLEESGPGIFNVERSTRGGLVLFARFDAESEPRFEVSSFAPDGTAISRPIEPESYRPGRVIEMMEKSDWDVRVFRTLTHPMAAQRRADDAERREALEALGYIE